MVEVALVVIVVVVPVVVVGLREHQVVVPLRARGDLAPGLLRGRLVDVVQEPKPKQR